MRYVHSGVGGWLCGLAGVGEVGSWDWEVVAS
jgi:hypothetical protein